MRPGPAPSLDDPAPASSSTIIIAPRSSSPPPRPSRFSAHAAGAALKPEFRHGFAYSDCRGDDARLVIANLLGAQRHGAHILARHTLPLAARRGGGDAWIIDLERRDLRRALRPARPRASSTPRPAWVIAAGYGDRWRGCHPPPAPGQGQPHRRAARSGSGDHGYFLQTPRRPHHGGLPLRGRTSPPSAPPTSHGTRPPERVRIARPRDRLHAGRGEPLFCAGPSARRTSSGATPACARCFRGRRRPRAATLSTLTRDYSFRHRPSRRPRARADHLRRQAHHPPPPGRRCRRQARQASCSPPAAQPHWRRRRLPGGDLGAGGMEAFEAALKRDFPWLPTGSCGRYARLYGSRARALLDQAPRRSASSAPTSAPTSTGARSTSSIDSEWVRTADDIIWRRTKLGLRLSAADVESPTLSIPVWRAASPHRTPSSKRERVRREGVVPVFAR
mgnify:CR=1 FL=1